MGKLSRQIQKYICAYDSESHIVSGKTIKMYRSDKLLKLSIGTEIMSSMMLCQLRRRLSFYVNTQHPLACLN